MIQAFILTPRGNFYIGTFHQLDRQQILDEMRMVAQHRGYPIEIQWGNHTKPTIVSHRTQEHRRLITNLQQHKETLWRLQKCAGGVVKKASKTKLKRDINRTKSEIRRIERQLRKAGSQPLNRK